MSVLAIKAIQEQQQQLDQLKTENAQLKARLEAIEQYLKKN
jgi:cell division protein FtsB